MTIYIDANIHCNTAWHELRLQLGRQKQISYVCRVHTTSTSVWYIFILWRCIRKQFRLMCVGLSWLQQIWLYLWGWLRTPVYHGLVAGSRIPSPLLLFAGYYLPLSWNWGINMVPRGIDRFDRVIWCWNCSWKASGWLLRGRFVAQNIFLEPIVCISNLFHDRGGVHMTNWS